VATFTTYSKNALYILDRRIISDRKREEIGSIAHGDSWQVKVCPSPIPSIDENGEGVYACKIVRIKKKKGNKERERERESRGEERRKERESKVARVRARACHCRHVARTCSGFSWSCSHSLTTLLRDALDTRVHSHDFTNDERAAGQRG